MGRGGAESLKRLPCRASDLQRGNKSGGKQVVAPGKMCETENKCLRRDGITAATDGFPFRISGASAARDAVY